MLPAVVLRGVIVVSLCAKNEKSISSFQCCLKDEGRPFTHALQEECVNRFMVLSCKSGMVLSDEVKGILKVSGECKRAERK